MALKKAALMLGIRPSMLVTPGILKSGCMIRSQGRGKFF
jgi:hypothetical protein